MTKETYGNPYRSGEKNIDDLHKSLIRDLMKSSKEETVCNYIMRDVFQIMKNLGWTDDDSFGVQVAGSLDRDKFIVIKNESLNPRPNKKVLPAGKGEPVKI